jgi:hypothetical protein
MNELQSTYGPLLLWVSFDHDIATHDQILPSTPCAVLYESVPQSLSWEQHTFFVKRTKPNKHTQDDWVDLGKKILSGELLLMPRWPNFDP